MPLTRVLRSIAPRQRRQRQRHSRVASIVEPAPMVEDIFEPRPPVPDYEQNRSNWFRRVGSAYRLGRREGDTLNYVFSAMVPFSGNRLLNTQIRNNTLRRNNRMRVVHEDADEEMPTTIHTYGYSPEKPPSYKSVKSSSDKQTRKKKKNSPKPPRYIDVKYSPPPIKPPSYTRTRRSRGGNKRKTCKKY